MEKPASCFFLFFIHIAVFLLSTTPIISVTNETTDRDALLAFKSAITSDPFQILTNWSADASSTCNWTGVSCDGINHQRITALNFSGFAFRGPLSPFLGNLTLLTSLDLSSNNFTGFIPDHLSNLVGLKAINLGINNLTGEIPAWIGTLRGLERIILNDNRFSGGIPPSLGEISELRVLNLRYNSLGGSIPQEIGNLSSLETLVLSDNQFTGSIPSSIGWLTKLESLFLGANSFQGGIPPSLRNLSSLQELNIRSASLTGQIPSFIFNMSSLETIVFSNNTLSGSLPTNLFFNLPNLEQLFLDTNQLTGQILDRIWECKRLWVVSLSTNGFTGNIPKNIGNLTDLRYLYLDSNNFTGALPAELGTLNLVQINVRGNNLSGAIPYSIFNVSTMELMELSINHFSGQLPLNMGISLPNLYELYLGDNKLSGVIPSSISNASSLTILYMGLNAFSGPVPDFGNLRFLQRLFIGGNNLTGQSQNQDLRFLTSLTKCRDLEFLELSQNQLEGILPSSMGNFSDSLKVFRAFDCRLRGSIPVEIGKLTSLLDLYLDNNQLTGIIPTTIGNLKQLVRIYLEHNKLEGFIPSDLCQLTNLGDFYVSNNTLRGLIPSCFGEMKSMRRLYLDSNKLESDIPSNLWQLDDLLAMNLSSNMLSGSLPSEIQNLKAIGDLDLSWNQLSGDIPISIDGAESLFSLSLAHNNFQGSIPQSLGKLRGLEYLDLSWNNLSGSIPNSLEGLPYLRHFNVSYNRLEGRIPTGGNFTNFTAQSFVNNYNLCGPTRLQVPPCRDSPKETRSKNLVSLVKYIIPPTAIAIIAAIMILLILRRRKRKSSKELPDGEASLLQSWRGSSYLELEQATNSFSDSNILGSGSFGSVFTGILSDGSIVAVKVFKSQSEKVIKSFVTEIEVLSAIRHRNLIKILGCCYSPDFKALILEYMPNGSLEKWLYSHNHFLDLLQRLNIAMDVAFALEYLHVGQTFPIVHCDLKPSNVLLDKYMTAKVGDFGIAKLFDEGELMAQTKTLATIGYMAPEYGAQGIVSTSGDVYSFGIMLLEIFTRKKPTDEMFGEEMSLKSWASLSLNENTIDKVVDSSLLGIEDMNFSRKEKCLSSVLSLAMDCLTISPSDRISISEIVVKLEKIRTVFLATTNK